MVRATEGSIGRRKTPGTTPITIAIAIVGTMSAHSRGVHWSAPFGFAFSSIFETSSVLRCFSFPSWYVPFNRVATCRRVLTSCRVECPPRDVPTDGLPTPKD